jgi:hypothetical protein
MVSVCLVEEVIAHKSESECTKKGVQNFLWTRGKMLKRMRGYTHADRAVHV